MTMRNIFLFLILLCSLKNLYGQHHSKLTSLENVEILNNNTEEAIYYYQNNWKKLREKALEKGYIDSFQLLHCNFSKETPFHLVLITTFKNQKQFDEREKHFEQLIKQSGGLKLLNHKKPSEFRTSVFSIVGAKHL